ncbi:hypothetical protein B0H13DRAFT_2349622 [Mycena leptocephala]|nr:hypothetical protein B0H13DRAFT_2349622 [Mycena leptocephala]
MGKKRKRDAYTHDPSIAKSVTSTATNHRVREEIRPAAPRSPEKRRTDNFDDLMGGPAAIKIKKKAPRYENSDHPVKTWIPSRDISLDGLLRQEGRGAWWTHGCAQCQESNPSWRCEDCFGGRLLCIACVTDKHQDEPLHILQEWRAVSSVHGRSGSRAHIPTGTFAQGGMRVRRLTLPVKGFTVPTTTVFTVDINFCGCPGAAWPLDQLLDVGWYPATTKDPSTAATISLLRRFHKMNLQARLPAYDFYNALVLLTNGAGLRKIPNRLPQFMDMIREYRHLQMSWRAGNSMPCLSSPGINLPEGWEDAPPDVAWLYRLLVSKDANFKMKGRDRSSKVKDPTLGPGWAYMVANDDYLKHLVKYVNEDEISHCVSFAALWSANNKRAKGLHASGIGSVSCSRHEMFRPLGTGDLQKGERYSNMDYLFFSSLIGITVITIVASYDIACQWSRNFLTRAKAMPDAMKLPNWIKMLFKECHGPYSFNYTKGVGRTDGEGVERNWSWLNSCGPVNLSDGPGSHVDFGNSLLRKMVLAIPQAMLHSRAFHAFTEGLREGHEEDLLKWRRWCGPGRRIRHRRILTSMWRSKRRPWQMSCVACGRDHARVVENEVEEAQEAVLLEAKHRNRTTIQATNLQRQRTLLLGKISKLQDIQDQYMPGLRQWPLAKARRCQRREAVCVAGLAEQEDRLRKAQAEDALRTFGGPRTRTFAHRFKRKHLAGQGMYTKSRSLLDTIEDGIRDASSRYRVARTALLELRGPGDWERVLRVLKKDDIRGMNERLMNEEEKDDNKKARR